MTSRSCRFDNHGLAFERSQRQRQRHDSGYAEASVVAGIRKALVDHDVIHRKAVNNEGTRGAGNRADSCRESRRARGLGGGPGAQEHSFQQVIEAGKAQLDVHVATNLVGAMTEVSNLAVVANLLGLEGFFGQTQGRAGMTNRLESRSSRRRPIGRLGDVTHGMAAAVCHDVCSLK